MNHKLFLMLATLVIFTLTFSPDLSLSGQEASVLFSKEEITAPITNEPGIDESLSLKSFKPVSSESYNNPHSLFITIHSPEHIRKYPEILRVWKMKDGKYTLISRFTTYYDKGPPYFGNYYYFHDFYVFNYEIKDIGIEHFLVIQKKYRGFEYSIYRIMPDGSLDEICYKGLNAFNLINKDETIWSIGNIVSFSDNTIGFKAGVWGRDDPMCCPTRGEIHGKLKIVKTNSSTNSADSCNHFEIIIDTYNRVPLEEETK